MTGHGPAGTPASVAAGQREVARPCTGVEVTKRQTGRGSVRRLLFAASLALIALVPAWATPEVAAAADRLPEPARGQSLPVPDRQQQRPATPPVHEHPHQQRRRTHRGRWRGDPAHRLHGASSRSSTTTPAGSAGWTPRPRCGYAGDGHNHWHVEQHDGLPPVVQPRHHGPTARSGSASSTRPCGRRACRARPGSPHYRESWCGGRTALTSRTGISVGWADTYRWSLPYQWIDITGLPGGTYTVRAMSDPNDWFLEEDETGRCGWTQGAVRLERHVGLGRRLGARLHHRLERHDLQAPHRLGVRERHHRRLRPRHVLLRQRRDPRARWRCSSTGRCDLPADERGLLRRRRRRDRRGGHQPPGRGRHHGRLRRAPLLPEPDR